MTLTLQRNWQKQIADDDFNHYKRLYFAYLEKDLISQSTLSSDLLTLIPLRKAFNHKQQLLITTLVVNETSSPYRGERIRTNYLERNQTATTSFMIHDLTLLPNDATIWTIIFSHHCFKTTDLTELTV